MIEWKPKFIRLCFDRKNKKTWSLKINGREKLFYCISLFSPLSMIDFFRLMSFHVHTEWHFTRTIYTQETKKMKVSFKATYCVVSITWLHTQSPLAKVLIQSHSQRKKAFFIYNFLCCRKIIITLVKRKKSCFARQRELWRVNMLCLEGKSSHLTGKSILHGNK